VDTDTRIFGYTDGFKVHPQVDDVVLCPGCGGKYHAAAPNEWRILRGYDQETFADHKCDGCQKPIFTGETSLSDALAPGRVERRGWKQKINQSDDLDNPRLVVYAKYLETLEF